MPNIEANRGVTYSGCMHDFSSGMFVAFFASVQCHLALACPGRGVSRWGNIPQAASASGLRGSSVILGIGGVWMRLDMCVIRRASRGVMDNIVSLGK